MAAPETPAPDPDDPADTEVRKPRRLTSPWLFLPAMAPFGATSGQVQVALPYLLTVRDHLSMAQIGALSSLTYLPHSLKFLWTPLLDTLIRRKYWGLWCSLVTTVATVAVFFIPAREHFTLLTAVLLVANFASATSSSALGVLCATTVAEERKGLASGCFSAGQLAATGLLGGLMLLLAEPPRSLQRFYQPMSPAGIGLIIGTIMLAASLVPLWIDEPPPQERALLPLLRTVFLDTWATIRSRFGWTGILICLSPVGSAAAANLFGALAPDYHATATDVTLATGLVFGLANAVGAMGGGWLADRMNRRLAYMVSGALTGVAALGLALFPATRATYVTWTLAYGIATGLAYAAFYAFVFEMIGPTEGASTKYGLFIGTSNLAIAYVTYVDGSMYKHGGRIGLLASDAALNVLGIVFLYATGILRRSAPAKEASA